MANLSYVPWGLLILGAIAFVVVWRRFQSALSSRDLTLQRILQAVESTTEAIGIGDFEGNSIYHNRAHIALFGYTVEELNAVPGSGVLFADKAIAGTIIATIRSGRSWSGETDILAKDGRKIPAYVRADIIRDNGGTPVGIFGVFRDITRERRMAEEAARAQKLDSLGMMAGGIAHDFNNLITVILAHVDLARDEPELLDETRLRLDEIKKVTGRAKDLTSQLKAFAKGETPAKRLLLLAPVAREAVDLALQNSSVRARWDFDRGMPKVLADEAQMLQVINNLALNAVQAMPEGGDLTVEGRVIEASEAAASSLAERRWVRLTIADSGVGIPPENLARIFEPFFTTKKTGTGLGLATCFSIVSKHGGHLRVESNPGKGTTFHMILPAEGAA